MSPAKNLTTKEIEEREVAIKVLLKSKIVNEWLKGECAAYGVDIESPNGKKFREKRGREYATKLIREGR